MAVKIFRPTSPGTRFKSEVKRTEGSTNAPHKPLLDSKKRTGGRDNRGLLAIRHRGGGHKRRYRVIDFRRDKHNIPGKVETLEYDPNRTANIALVCYADGERRYILAPSGLEVGALGGAPGVFSARFSDPGATDLRNIRKVLRLMKSAPPEERGARFVCSMVLSHEGRVLKTTRGVVRGRIIDTPRGHGGFGYDPIFYYRPRGRTFGELSTAEKEPVSHRGRALAKMIAFLAGREEKGRPLPVGRGRRGAEGDAPDGRERKGIRRPAGPSA